MGNIYNKIKYPFIYNKTSCRAVNIISPISNHWCGYVGLDKSHILYKMKYDSYYDINFCVDVFGGVTYSQLEDDGLWWVGFDTYHPNTHGVIDQWTQAATESETKHLADQLLNKKLYQTHKGRIEQWKLKQLLV